MSFAEMTELCSMSVLAQYILNLYGSFFRQFYLIYIPMLTSMKC